MRRGNSLASVSIASRTFGGMTGDFGQTACASKVTAGTDFSTCRNLPAATSSRTCQHDAAAYLWRSRLVFMLAKRRVILSCSSGVPITVG